VDELVRVLGHQRLDGLSLVVDGANGAASTVDPEILRLLGAKVTTFAVDPDGRNINDRCGATSTARLQALVRHLEADAGLAFDGDADRLIAVDENGEVVDGDHILPICALDRHRRGVLPGSAVVATVMSNLGLRLALTSAGIAVHECPVGDRHVVAALQGGGWLLGGEQSGHIVFRDIADTGDGIVTAVQLLDVMRCTGKSLAELAAEIPLFPQILENIPVPEPEGVAASPALAVEIAAVRNELGNDGRVLVRATGTEPVVRVMVEARDAAAARRAVDRLSEAVRAAAEVGSRREASLAA
jgi:phosphoglucosamine mutase